MGSRPFNPGPPSNPRRVGFYGHFKRGVAAKRFRVNQAHAAALLADSRWTAAARALVRLARQVVGRG